MDIWLEEKYKTNEGSVINTGPHSFLKMMYNNYSIYNRRKGKGERSI